MDIKVDYDELESICDSVGVIISGLSAELSNYETIIRNIISSNEWVGVEKGIIVSVASGAYYNYFNYVIEDLKTYKQQIENKIKDFKEAEGIM